MLEIADPERAGLTPRPTATDLFCGDAQFAASGSLTSQMVIEGASRDAATELVLEDPIDDAIRASRLFFLQLHRSGQ
jgi:hypothetical protein